MTGDDKDDNNNNVHDGKNKKTLKVASAGSLILLQLFTRILTLFMTQMQIRLTSAEVLGAANIHFELMLGLILTLSREGFRTALSRSTISASTHNVALLPIPIGIVMSIFVMFIYTSYLAPIELAHHPHFYLAVLTFLTGAILELLAEPLYIATLMRLETMTRVKAEGLAITAKGTTILILLAIMQDPSTLLPFGLGQMAFGISFLAVFWLSHVKQSGIHDSILYLQPKQVSEEEQHIFDRQAMWLLFTMTRQNLVKHGLGEGDKFAVARLASLSDQGSYALASNYGSLVARILYQPLEESSRLTFARALGDSPTPPSNDSLDLAYNLLSTLLSFYVILSLFLITFCPPYSSTLLLVLAGKRWAYQTSAPTLLGVYGSTYLPAMAFNGLLEGFLQACASPLQLTRYAFILIAASGVFIVTLMTLLHFDMVAAEKGLIIASSVSTLVRAAYCYHFTSSTYYKGKQQQQQRQQQLDKDQIIEVKSGLSLSRLIVHPATLATFALSAAIVYNVPYSSNKVFSLKHTMTGLMCALMCAGACIIFERRILLGTLHIIRGKNSKTVG